MWIDEPVNKAAYDAFAAVNERLRKIEPRYRIVAPFYEQPGFRRQASSCTT